MNLNMNIYIKEYLYYLLNERNGSVTLNSESAFWFMFSPRRISLSFELTGASRISQRPGESL